MRFITCKIIMICLFILLTFSKVLTQKNEIQKELDDFIQPWDQPDHPGFILGIIQNHKLVYKRHVGVANLDHNVPVNFETVFDIGSLSKQFTAACIAHLIINKKLSLSDDIHKFIPDFPVLDDTIRIHHLIHHTSGIRDYMNMMILAGNTIGLGYNEHNVLKWIYRQNGLNFHPGDAFSYSNSNYSLLAYIVKQITGKSIGQYAKENLFEPLGMHHTFYLEDLKMIVKNRAIGYKKEGDETYKQEHWFNSSITGPGGVHTTLNDLLLWDQNFYKNKIGDSDFLGFLHSQQALNNGYTNDYSFGNLITEFRGYRVVWHSGELPGFTSHMLRIPDKKFTVIFLSNMGGLDSWSFIAKAADLFFPETPVKQEQEEPVESPERKVISIDPGVYDQYAGKYELDEGGLIMNFSREGNQFILEVVGQGKFPIFPESETKFFLKIADAQCTFQKDQAGKVSGIIWHQGGRETAGRKISSTQLSITQKKEYVGTYYSKEMDVNYTVLLDGEELLLSLPGHKEFIEKNGNPLKHVEEDNFTSYMFLNISLYFTKNTENVVNGFILNESRAKNVFFQKL